MHGFRVSLPRERGGEVGAHHVVQAHRDGTWIVAQERQVVEPVEQRTRLRIRVAPEQADRRNGNGGFFGEDRQFHESAALFSFQLLEAEVDGDGDGQRPVACFPQVERRRPLAVELLLDEGQRTFQCVALADEAAER